MGWKVLRFSDREIEEDADACVEKVLDAADVRM
jgi:very-short-patch-repair endonuclease